MWICELILGISILVGLPVALFYVYIKALEHEQNKWNKKK